MRRQQIYQPIAAHGVGNADLMVVAGVADVVIDRWRLSDYIRAVTSEVRPEPRKMRPEPLEGRPDGLAQHANLPSGNTPMAPNDAFFAYLDSCEVRQELGVVVELGRRPDGTMPGLS